MSRMLFILLAASALFAADDPWTKVKELKTGAELRVYKKGVVQPLAAKMDELTADNLLVVVKSAQVAISRDQIDRIDYRPPAGKATVESKAKTTDTDTSPGPPGHGSRTPGTSTSSNITFGSRPDFETVYRRPAPAPKK